MKKEVMIRNVTEDTRGDKNTICLPRQYTGNSPKDLIFREKCTLKKCVYTGFTQFEGTNILTVFYSRKRSLVYINVI